MIRARFIASGVFEKMRFENADFVVVMKKRPLSRSHVQPALEELVIPPAHTVNESPILGLHVKPFV